MSGNDSSGHAEPPFEPGEVLNDTYELLEDIGFGAMGQVIAALDRRLNRRVAIKVAWTDQSAGRLRAEAQALAAIRHPGLPTVHALAVHRGHEYLVMELIHGVGLNEHLRQKAKAGEALAISEAVELMICIADALCAVHAAGLAHRDLKPANIMLTAGERLVLLDFGLFVPQFEPGKQAKILGSPWYMAPEVIRNEVEVGGWHLIDLYALGVVGFEMIAGQPPFPSADVREVLRGHVRGEVPDISLIRDDIPPPLAALIRELLAKLPSERPPTAESVLQTLRAIAARLREDERKNAFDVLVASPRRAALRALATHLRKAMPDVQVRAVARGESLFEQVERRMPNIALVDNDIPDAHPMEVAMYLRGSSDGCAIGWFGGDAQGAERELLERLRVSSLPPIDGDDSGPVMRLIREARRARR